MQQTIYKCDKCQSAGQTEAFRLSPANFTQLTVTKMPLTGGMPGGQGSTSDSFQICSTCKDTETDNIFTALEAVISPLRPA